MNDGRQRGGSSAQSLPKAECLAEKTVEQLASEQGVVPLADVQTLRGDFWPEDEPIEEFLDELRRWRREGRDAR